MGLVAGFVETGETLEQAVNREVMEETGLKIKNLRYIKSQVWPFLVILWQAMSPIMKAVIYKYKNRS